MSKELLNEAISLVIGKPGTDLVDILYGKGNINEFLIAKKLDLTINQVRNLLYKISDKGLVSFIRKKDEVKGWYTYFWKIELLKTFEFYKDYLYKRLIQFENQVKNRETKTYYVCGRCNLEYNEESALLKNFTCDECGDVFVIKDNASLLKDLNKIYDKTKNKIEIIEGIITLEKEKLNKIREKERDKKLKDEKKVRDLKRMQRNEAKKKVDNKTKFKKAKGKPSFKKLVSKSKKSVRIVKLTKKPSKKKKGKKK